MAYVPFVGGAELAVKEITDRMPEYEFHMITHRFDRGWARCETIGNIKVFRVGWGGGKDSYYGQALGKFLFMPLAFWKALRMRRKNSYAVFWSLMASRAAGPVFFLKLMYPRIPFFLTIQEGDTPEYAHRRAGAFRVLWRCVFRMADRIQAISLYLKDWCIREGADPDRITVVPNGIDIKKFTYSAEVTSAAKAGHVPSSKFQVRNTVITTSRLVRKNGIDILIQAIARIKNIVPDIQCVIIGDGPEKDALRALAVTEGVGDRVRFLGAVPNSDIPMHLAEADVFVRPSRSEGLGTSFLEAMAAGLPIIAPSVGGIPDFLIDGVTGLFMKPEDSDDCAKSIERIFADASLRATIVHNASELIRTKYTWDIVSKKIGSILNEVIEDFAKKRVVLVSGIFPPDIGGPASYSGEILGEFWIKRRIKIPIITYGSKKNARPHTIESWKSVHRLSRKFPKGIRHLMFFFMCLWHVSGKDIIFSVDASMGGGLPAMIAAVIMRKCFIVRVTGEYAWEQGQARFGITDSLDEFQTKKYNPIIEIFRFLEHLIVARADAIITPSDYLKRIVVGWGISPDKVSVVYNAVSISAKFHDAFEISKQDARSKLGLVFDIPIVISIGRLVPWKGFNGLIEAFKYVLKEVPGAKLFIIGSGPEERNIVNAIYKFKLQGHVYMLGQMPQETLGIYLKAADLFVLNTAYEGFSHQLIEALALRIPVITTRVGGNPEVITDGENGVLIEYNDIHALSGAMRRILSDNEFRNKLVKNTDSFWRKYTVENMVQGLIRVIESL